MLRLVGGDETSGLLEYHDGSSWGTVCGIGFTGLNAHVACRQLGFASHIDFTVGSLGGSGPISLGPRLCTGGEARLESCIGAPGLCLGHLFDVELSCRAADDLEVRFVDDGNS
jgi:hypothetical protein